MCSPGLPGTEESLFDYYFCKTMLQHVTLQYQLEIIAYACILHGNTLIKAGPDIILNRFSTINVVPSMLGSPL